MQPLPLYKIVKMWFLPPGIFVVLLVLLACYMAYSAYAIGSKTPAARPLKVACGSCLALALVIYSLSVNAIAQRMMHCLEYQYQRVETKVEAIVCISGDFEAQRERAAVQLYKKYKVPVILSGYGPDIIRRMVKQGIPENKMTFDRAFNTKENVQFTLPVAKAKGYKKVYLVSSANHMPRTVMNFEKAYKNNRIDVVPWPAGYYTSKVHKVKELEWVPDIDNLKLSTRVWHECVGMLELWID